MLDQLTEHLEAIADLCRRFGVVSLAVFGSAAGEQFEPSRSDVDFLVEFDPEATTGRFDAYFGLKERLEDLLGHPVDLVTPGALANPYFAQSVARTREELYAA
jgi:uncharacterized protein